MLYRSNIDNDDDDDDDDDDDNVSKQYTTTTIYSWAEFNFVPIVKGNVLTAAVTSYSFTY